MILETERLILRPWEESDAEELYRYASHPDVGPITGWAVHQSAEESRQVIRTVLSAPETYAAVLKETGRPVGSISLMTGARSNIGLPDEEGEIGYWIGVPYWGRGLIPEAVREIMRHGFEDLGLVKLWCGYFEGNLKSKRVQEKCGFRYHHTAENVPCAIPGLLRTEYVSCIPKEEWAAGQAKKPVKAAGNAAGTTVCRFAEEKDLERVNELRRQVNDVHVNGKPEIFKPGFSEEMRGIIYEIFRDPLKKIAVCERDGQISGFAVLHRVSRPESHIRRALEYLDIDEFGVDEACRREGIGTCLVGFLREYARRNGIGRIELNMWDFNQGALAFYEAAGFSTYRRYLEMKL